MKNKNLGILSVLVWLLGFGYAFNLLTPYPDNVVTALLIWLVASNVGLLYLIKERDKNENR